MAPIFTGLRLSFGRSAEVSGPSSILVDYLVAAGGAGGVFTAGARSPSCSGVNQSPR